MASSLIVRVMLKWLWVAVEPEVKKHVQNMAGKAGNLVRTMSERIKTRAQVSQEKADQAAAMAREAESDDPIEAARQRGRQEAYEEMAQALGVDAETLRAGADDLRDRLLADGERMQEQLRLTAKKQAQERPDQTS
ncbi:hypothetical protein [Bordetella sp. BOR01]|uniref:hypothetical protein n=1 Tax=Bordetella sp. BOR01 TaxID=2854779 RepID=UPI001C4563BB|nr:hypothetical protein [Bordetella sp. BOR01]MBV7482512.1 hypothetical protein [Bordetella sp. BOR01]